MNKKLETARPRVTDICIQRLSLTQIYFTDLTKVGHTRVRALDPPPTLGNPSAAT